eukprot:scaffold1486_cov329-Prasinococcus_capsulatus_cf.AAC.11
MCYARAAGIGNFVALFINRRLHIYSSRPWRRESYHYATRAPQLNPPPFWSMTAAATMSLPWLALATALLACAGVHGVEDYQQRRHWMHHNGRTSLITQRIPSGGFPDMHVEQVRIGGWEQLAILVIRNDNAQPWRCCGWLGHVGVLVGTQATGGRLAQPGGQRGSAIGCPYLRVWAYGHHEARRGKQFTRCIKRLTQKVHCIQSCATLSREVPSA